MGGVALSSKSNKKGMKRPTVDQLSAAIQEELARASRRRVFFGSLGVLITVSAVAVLIAVLLLPVLRIHGDSMEPSLYAGDFVVSVKPLGISEVKPGDVVAFYYNNKVLVKRAIAREGSWVDMDQDGYVYVDGVKLEEPWLLDSLHHPGQCDIELPYQVPEGRLFVLGDNRDVSVDSRSKSVGCIPEELLVGKLVYRLWPLDQAGWIE